TTRAAWLLWATCSDGGFWGVGSAGQGSLRPNRLLAEASCVRGEPHRVKCVCRWEAGSREISGLVGIGEVGRDLAEAGWADAVADVCPGPQAKDVRGGHGLLRPAALDADALAPCAAHDAMGHRAPFVSH